MAEAETKALTKTEKKSMLKEAEGRFREIINELAKRKLELGKNEIQFKYDMGTVAVTMVEEQSKEFHERTYGTHVVEDIAKALGEETPTIYSAIKFAKLFNSKDLKHILSNNWPWRGLRSLVTIEDPDDRKKFQQDWEAGKYKNSDEFNAAIKKYKEGVKADNGGDDPPPPTRGLSQALRTTTTILTKVNGEVIPELLAVSKDFAKHEAEVTEKIAERAKELKEQLPLVKQLAVDVEKALKAAGV